jgi:DNA-binding IclR family transcriptional regulator
MNAKVGQSEALGQDPSPPTGRVVAVVELLAERREAPSTLAEICRELGISRSTGHAIVHTLSKFAWISRDPVSGTYSLGPALPAMFSVSAPPLSRTLRELLRELCAVIDMPACISKVSGGSIAVVEAVAPGSARPHVPAGVRLPFVAPFGREFVAWAPASVRNNWLDAVGPVNDVYRARMPKVLNEIRKRGYGLERLSDPLTRVYAALLALDDGDLADPVSVRLAGAVADLTIVDFLPGELADVEANPLATITAPIFDTAGAVVMSMSAQPYRRLTPAGVVNIGERVIEFAEMASSLLP